MRLSWGDFLRVLKRANTYHLRKRVPRRYHGVEARKDIWISLHTDSESVAQTKAGIAWNQLIEGWEARLAGDTENSEKRFEAAKRMAEVRGFRYLDAVDVAELPREEFLARVDAVVGRDTEPNLLEAAAVLGAVAKPSITITKALELYWGLAADRTIGKSDDQLRRWKNPRVKAVRNFIGVVGDKALHEISADDMLDFREWWMERMEKDQLTANSANKDLTHFKDVLKTVNKMKRLGIELPLSDLMLKEGESRQRPSFSEAWIKEKLLQSGALGELNNEARCLLLGMINTGYRPSEAAQMTAAQIRLEFSVPHISIEPVSGHLKTKNARRLIPLAGVSLQAFRECSNGFPRYRKNASSLSATVNKFLTSKGLKETPNHSLYSLRHSFEDRLLAAGVDERVRRDLFGHALERERYGQGASLEMLQTVVHKIAL